jgi:hypothetical protein
MRQKLAGIYARMFEFYKSAIEWYLSSKLARAFRSTNENLRQIFDGAVKNIEDEIVELYREASIGTTAMLAMMNGKVSMLEAELRRQRRNYRTVDAAGAYRMRNMLQATWMEDKVLKWTIESRKLNELAIEPQPCIQDVPDSGMKRAEARALVPSLEPFINGEEGPAFFVTGNTWLVEDAVQMRLRKWMYEDSESRVLWISSPAEQGVTVTASKAAALATVSAAWQAETPVISHFCRRPPPNRLSKGMTFEQQGLIGLVYSFINQLLQLNSPEDRIIVDEKDLTALHGGMESWEASLQVLRALLVQTPKMMVCVIDSLNDLAWGDGGRWCNQLLDVLLTRQEQPGTVFNILVTTSGQSQVLPHRVQLKDRHMTTKRAKEVTRFGKLICI